MLHTLDHRLDLPRLKSIIVCDGNTAAKSGLDLFDCRVPLPRLYTRHGERCKEAVTFRFKHIAPAGKDAFLDDCGIAYWVAARLVSLKCLNLRRRSDNAQKGCCRAHCGDDRHEDGHSYYSPTNAHRRAVGLAAVCGNYLYRADALFAQCRKRGIAAWGFNRGLVPRPVRRLVGVGVFHRPFFGSNSIFMGVAGTA